MKNRTTASLLALLIGGLGVHQFYLGNTLKGIIYICFSWTLIPVVISLVDFIVLITMHDHDFNARYNHMGY
ncbi:MAG: NINE protein [Cyclobacteriaceae bacterium]